jgi:peptidoglycan/xylan/chitin deacetylase (PgdA/CDA1 family)
LFRPPYGVTNPKISKVLKKLEMISIGWDVRSLDTVLSNSNVLYERVIRGIEKGGSIILFHDRCNSTIESLENIINYCQKNNLQFKTITEIIDEK